MMPEVADVAALGSGVVVTLGAIAFGVQKLLNMRKGDQITSAGLGIYAEQFAAVQGQLAVQQVDLTALRKEQSELHHTVHRQRGIMMRSYNLLLLFKGLLVKAEIELSSYATSELAALEIEDARA